MRAFIVSVLTVAVAAVVAAPSTGASYGYVSFSAPLAAAAAGASYQDEDFAERDEVRQSVKLSSGANVEVRGINGAVTVETGGGDTAEILIVRSAKRREDLQYHKVFIEGSGGSLVIRGESERNGG